MVIAHFYVHIPIRAVQNGEKQDPGQGMVRYACLYSTFITTNDFHVSIPAGYPCLRWLYHIDLQYPRESPIICNDCMRNLLV